MFLAAGGEQKGRARPEQTKSGVENGNQINVCARRRSVIESFDKYIEVSRKFYLTVVFAIFVRFGGSKYRQVLSIIDTRHGPDSSWLPALEPAPPSGLRVLLASGCRTRLAPLLSLALRPPS